MESYLLTVFPKRFATRRCLPCNTSPVGPLRPVMKLALIAAPVVASYLPTVPVVKFATKRKPEGKNGLGPTTASPVGSPLIKMKSGVMAAPVSALYLLIWPLIWPLKEFATATKRRGNGEKALGPVTASPSGG